MGQFHRLDMLFAKVKLHDWKKERTEGTGMSRMVAMHSHALTPLLPLLFLAFVRGVCVCVCSGGWGWVGGIKSHRLSEYIYIMADLKAA